MYPARRRKLAKFVFVLLLMVGAASAVYAFFHSGPWIVPEEAKRMPNPIKPSQANPFEVHRMYLDKCAECHGETGKGDGNQSKTYNTPPTNFTDTARMSTMGDGELFYKITEGHRPMPGFKKRLTEEQRWQLVLFVRSFAEQAGQQR